jgi:tetratricopeptide (TPR) repeat protein
MIRRDYILRMIEECIRALTQTNSLKQEQRWSEADVELQNALKKLLDLDLATVKRFSAADLIVQLMQAGPTYALPEKMLVLTALLKEAGDVATGNNLVNEGRDHYLKALHLLLDALTQRDISECPPFVPNIETLRTLLVDTPLPPPLLAMLMQHYERAGEYAKAEDALFELLDADPGNREVLNFGAAFYHRLLQQSDADLDRASLPRAEVEEGLKNLQERQPNPPPEKSGPPET